MKRQVFVNPLRLHLLLALGDEFGARHLALMTRDVSQWQSLLRRLDAERDFDMERAVETANELVTNASKYGALANETGRVSIAWVVDKSNLGRSVRVSWIEHGGPTVQVPDNEGFGTRLIKANVEYELGGQANLQYQQEGFRAEIVLPVPEREACGTASTRWGTATTS